MEQTNGWKNFKVFDAAEFLDSEELIAAYISDAMEDRDPDVLLSALADVARARGMAKLAKDSGLGRENLYKTLSPGAKPRFETIMKIINALGVKLQAVPTSEVSKVAV